MQDWTEYDVKTQVAILNTCENACDQTQSTDLHECIYKVIEDYVMYRR